MTEQLHDVNAQPVNPQMQQPAPAALTPEQFDAIKRSLLENLHNSYGQFIKSIASIPAAQLPMQEAFRHLDTGFLWFEKAIINMPMPNVQVAQVPQSEAAGQQAAPQEVKAPSEEVQEQVASGAA